ncbi:hypothetical protein LBMAG33_0790 [Candidatus Levyibacteriota bacterium]|nr:hypothetical protein [Candidatus Levybacteria bacterium]MSU26251.1 hypothetical protein [Candidatus Levybacteria bacterium]GDX61769.1 hypothetical protein LBMAG33_0790 [Candidatus Levybacteria bacterium]
MDDTNNENIEVIEKESKPTQIINDDLTVLLSLESLIKRNISKIEKLREDLKKSKQMLSDSFENDPTFREHAEKAKETSNIKNTTRQEILKQPSVSSVSAKVRDMSSELKEIQNSLSDYLKEYQRLSGSNEIEGEDGNLREIINTAKLIKRSSGDK